MTFLVPPVSTINSTQGLQKEVPLQGPHARKLLKENLRKQSKAASHNAIPFSNAQVGELQKLAYPTGNRQDVFPVCPVVWQRPLLFSHLRFDGCCRTPVWKV